MSLARLPRRGGALCLDFVNTVDPRYGDERTEYLPDYAALVDWSVWVGALPAERRDALLAALDGEAVFRRAHALRERLHALLGPRRAAGALPGFNREARAGALPGFNRELQRLGRHAALRPAGDRYALGWESAGTAERLLWPVVRSAAELMIAPALDRVRECDGENCGWLFLDTSKAGRRRWCSMEICGNRAKARRHRARA
jgi:predicted RNA-binding Zn ribbon-like protein